DVPWKKSVENPVGDQAQLTIQTWKLRDVNAAPKQPGKEPFKMEPENFRHGRAPAEGAKFPKSCKSEVRFLCAAHRGHNVLGTSLGLAEGMLCGWRRHVSVDLLNRGAIADRPHPGPVGDLGALIDNDSALLLWDG